MVKIFTTPACPFCFVLIQFFKERNIEFEEIDISEDEKTREEVIKKSGQMSAPIVEINGEFVVGFDKKKICNLLGIKD